MTASKRNHREHNTNDSGQRCWPFRDSVWFFIPLTNLIAASAIQKWSASLCRPSWRQSTYAPISALYIYMYIDVYIYIHTHVSAYILCLDHDLLYRVSAGCLSAMSLDLFKPWAACVSPRCLNDRAEVSLIKEGKWRKQNTIYLIICVIFFYLQN